MTDSEKFPFHLISAATVRRLVFQDIEGCIRVVSDTYLAHAADQSVNPPSVFLHFSDRPNARIIALPSHLATLETSGIKWISSFPDNTKSGVARASAVLILNNHRNGYPFVCIEASVISASRTAASAVLAAYHLNGKTRRIGTLGIIGTGLIARYVYKFLMRTEWTCEEVLLYDPADGRTDRFSREVCDEYPHTRIRVANSAAAVLAESNLVVVATVASTPHIHDPDLLRHAPIVLHLSLRDLAPELLFKSQNIVDDIDHVLNANTSPHLCEQRAGNRDFITGTLAQVLLGERTVDPARPIIFSPFGLGVLDLAVGKWVYDRAVEHGDCLAVERFFD